jgi:hypothetical protein
MHGRDAHATLGEYCDLKFRSRLHRLARVIGFQFIQIIYWLALATWFGSVIFLAMAVPIIFRTVREARPVLAHVLSVNLEGQHSTLLGSSIVGNLLSRLGIVQLVCGGVVLIATILQLFTTNTIGTNLHVTIFRAVLCAAALAVVAYDRFVIWPKMARDREEYIEHADEPEIANPAKDRLDVNQRRSMLLTVVTFGTLLLLIVYSANIQPAMSATPETSAAQGGK